LLRGCVIPQGGVLPSILSFLLPKNTGGTPNQSSSTASKKSSVTKKTKAPTSAKTTGRKPALTKGGLGSFTVFSAPKSKVKHFYLSKQFNVLHSRQLHSKVLQ
jgi:hypothetical protein